MCGSPQLPRGLGERRYDGLGGLRIGYVIFRGTPCDDVIRGAYNIMIRGTHNCNIITRGTL